MKKNAFTSGLALISLSLLALACSSPIGSAPPRDKQEASLPFKVTEVASFNAPWAMAFLPGGRALVTEKAGKLLIWDGKGTGVVSVSGLPKVAAGGQGGLGDVALHPQFATNGLIYLSWVEAGQGGFGAVVGRGKLIEDAAGARIEGLTIIWTQAPKVEGRGHFGHRIAFAPDGKLFISSGERQKFDPAQEFSNVNLGRVVRLNDDGSLPADNPFSKGAIDILGNRKPYDPVTQQNWANGMRNPLGLAFDADGRLWELEMGPRHGDELNLVLPGKNYGYPKVSNGNHYDGRDIPDHKAGDGFEAPKVFWNPAISPGSLMIYSGALFPAWKGDAFIGALGGEALIRVDLNGDKASMADNWPMKTRIREVEQGPDGAIWLLEDGEDGRLMKLTPK
jgi:aldose sugar dehydrogenase